MKWVQPPTDIGASDEVLTRQVAEQLLEGDSQFAVRGFFIDGFPFNTKQALMLDKYINGVNLALFIGDAESESSALADLLAYY